MKRLLALLLCVTQLTGFVPHVHAEEATPAEAAECTHPEASLTETTRTKKNEGVKDITDTQHTRYFDVYGVYTCSACGETGIEKFIEAGTETEAHEYVNGVCVVKGCGAEEPECGHPEASLTETTRTKKNEGVKDITDTQHTRYFDVYGVYTCAACGETGIEKFIEAGTETEAHEYVNGVCVVEGCGKEEPKQDVCEYCGSSNTIETIGTSNYSWEKIDDAQHKESYDRVNVRACNDCGKRSIISVIESVKDEVSAHYFIDGVCGCGATSTCQHENTTTYEALYSEHYEYVDETSHKQIYKIADRTVCENEACAAEISFVDTGRTSETVQNHTFENGTCVCGATETEQEGCEHSWDWGTCTLCGAECEHPSPVEVNTWYSLVSGEWTNNNNGTHTGNCVKVAWTRCDVCSKYYEAPIEGEEAAVRTINCWRWNGETGKCAECGYQIADANDCTHENKTPLENSESNFSYTNNGDGTHTVSYDVNTREECDDCDMLFAEFLERITETEAHTYTDGVCACGATGESGESCTHPNIKVNNTYYQLVTGSEWISNNDGTHTGKAVQVNWWFCDDCDYGYEEEIGEPIDNYTEDCDFEDDVCVRCGYENACQHPTESVTSEERSFVIENVQKDATHHTVRTNPGVQYTCSACGATWDEKDTSTVEEFDAEHRYDTANECIDCGYVKPACDHSAGGTRTDEYEMEFATPVYKNEEFHIQKYTVTFKYECNTCGKLYDGKPSEMEGLGGHDYDETGKCACGAEGEYTGCAHENTEIRYSDENVVYSDIMESTHTKTADVYFYSWCLDCETRRTYQLDTPGEVTVEEHSYEASEPVVTESYDVTAEGHAVVTTTTTTYTCACGLSYDKKDTATGERVAHDFSDGDCVCGEKCPHEHRYPDEDNLTDKVLGAATPYTEEESPARHEVHKRAYTAKTSILCEECGAVVESGKEINGYESELHAWVNGECSACGYVCEHEFKGGVCANCEYECPHDSYTEGICDVCGSDCPHNKYTDGECDKCGEICAHEKYTDGKCDECGMVCAHESYTEGECDECGMVCAHEKYTDSVCDECGVVCAHEGYTNGVCDECGVVCAHESYTEGECDECGIGCEHEKYTEGVCDECGVICAHDSYAEGVCTECGTVCEHEAYDNGVCGECGILCAHESYTGGICDECGITCKHETYTDEVCDECGEPCKHIDRFEEDPIDEYPVNAEWKDAGDGTHIITVREVFNWECLDCGRKDFTVVTEQKQISEPHDWSNGDSVCAVCGGECAHEEREIMDYDRLVSEYTPYDSEHCTWTVDVYRKISCRDCNAQLSEELISAGEARFGEHVSDDGDYVCIVCGYQMPIPTPTPAPAVTPAPTKRPTTGGTVVRPVVTTEPTVAPTVEPTIEPTVEPTLAPVENEMVYTLVESVAAAEEEGSVVTIEVVGAQEVFTEEEHEQLKELPVAEQILVTLSTIGFSDVVEAAMTSMNVTLSDNAAQLVTKANETMTQMPEEERKAMQETIEKYFPKTQVQIDGVVYDYFILNLEIVVDGVARIESYGFRFDEELGQWIFVKMDTLDAEETV